MNKAQKQQYIENLDQMSKDYSAMFIASFSNMSVKEMIQFRTEIRNNEGITKISKNNIVKIFIDKYFNILAILFFILLIGSVLLIKFI